MSKKNKALISSIASIAMCTSLAIGGTYALFTDKSDVNIAVSSGKVDVNAYIDVDSVKTYSAKWENGSYAIVENAGLTFATDVDGNASVVVNENSNEMSISQMVAGDKVTFNLIVENESDVKIQYQTVIRALQDTGLFKDLEVSIDGVRLVKSNDATTEDSTAAATTVAEALSNWLPLDPDSADITVPVEIAMPLGVTELTEEYWASIQKDQYATSETCKIAYSVRAVQGNAHVVNPGAKDEPSDDNEVMINTVDDLFAFAKDVNVNGNNYAGKTVLLGANLDLAGRVWEPIGQTGGTYFQGTFDGQNYTIFNLNIEGGTDRDQWYSSGLFGWTEQQETTIQNVKVDGATVTGERYVGVIVGYLTGTVTNCEVTNATVVVNQDPNVLDNNNEVARDGDKGGLIVGYANANTKAITCNKVSDSTITGCRDLGAIVGGSNAAEVSKNNVSNVKVMISIPDAYTSTVRAGEVVGRLLQGTVQNNTVTNVEVIHMVNSLAQFKKALETSPENVTTEAINIMLADGTYNDVLTASNRKINIKGGTNAVIGITRIASRNHDHLSLSGCTVTLDGVSVNFADDCSYAAFINNPTMIYKNCTITGQFYIYGDTTFIGCTFDNDDEAAKSAMRYTYIYAGDVVVDDCDFYTQGHALIMYSDHGGAGDRTLTVRNSTFDGGAGRTAGAVKDQNTAAIEIDGSCGANYTLKLEGENTVSGGFSGLWRIKAVKADVTTTVDGVAYTSDTGDVFLDGVAYTKDADGYVTKKENA